jgi:hypothetical protein
MAQRIFPGPVFLVESGRASRRLVTDRGAAPGSRRAFVGHQALADVAAAEVQFASLGKDPDGRVMPAHALEELDMAR